MSEVMNRAARRAAGMKADPRKVTIRIRNQVNVVPMEHVESYFAHEISSEGKWAQGRSLTIVQPLVDAGPADSGWFTKTLERMWETRRVKGTLPSKIDLGQGNDVEIDVGLIDVTVFFELPPGLPPSLPTTQAEIEMTLTENFRHFDSVCAGAIHDQMIMASAMHRFHSNGSPLFHYHNLIFGLRQEVRGDVDILGPLDMDPLLRALAKSGSLSVIGGVRQ